MIKPDVVTYYELQCKGKETHYKWRWVGNMESYVERFSEDADGKGHSEYFHRFPSSHLVTSLVKAHKQVEEYQRLSPELKFRIIEVTQTTTYKDLA